MLPYYMFCTDAEEATYDEENRKIRWLEPEEDEHMEERLTLQQAIEVARYNKMRLVLEFMGHELELVDYTDLRGW